MAVGKNPYIEEPQFTRAAKKYKVTFMQGSDKKEVEVDPAQGAYGDH